MRDVHYTASPAGGYLVSLDSRYCGNVQREHNSNHVYVIIDQALCTLHCHDSSCAGWSKSVHLGATASGCALAASLYPDGYIATRQRIEKEDGLAFIQDAVCFVRVPLGGSSVKLLSRSEVTTCYENVFYASGPRPGASSDKVFIYEWLVDRYRRTFRGLDFYPSLKEREDGLLNTFCGFYWQRVAADDTVVPLTSDHPDVVEFMRLVDRGLDGWLRGARCLPARLHRTHGPAP